MALFKCKMCGGSLEINDGATVCECEYCGTNQTIPQNHDDVAANLFNRANNLRMKSEFDKAQEIYEKIISSYPNEAEAYWGMVLCKFGIEYVEDPATFAKIPTCHRTQLEAVQTDVDYKAAIENADAVQREIYEKEALAIDKLQKNILSIVHNEKPFDVFICYKESDENGKRTNDSVIANDIYHQLTQEGFKVFYAAITLEDKLGQEYEPYIFAALNSAKVMLVIGTKPEYFSAVWVKNEWSRYLKLMKNDRSKLLIPCYKDMDAYDLPEEFSHLQAQDMGKIGFINDVIRGIKKVLVKDEAKPVKVIKQTVSASSSIENLLKRGNLALEDGKWDEATDFFDRVLDENAEESRAYLGLFMAKTKLSTTADIEKIDYDISGNEYIKKAVRFADDKHRKVLDTYVNTCLLNMYVKTFYACKSKADYSALESLSDRFKAMNGFKDSASYVTKCDDEANRIIDGLVDRAFELLKKQSFDEAKNVLVVYNKRRTPTSKSYIGLLMSKYRVKSELALTEISYLQEDTNFINAKNAAVSDEDKKYIEEIEIVNTRYIDKLVEKARREVFAKNFERAKTMLKEYATLRSETTKWYITLLMAEKRCVDEKALVETDNFQLHNYFKEAKKLAVSEEDKQYIARLEKENNAYIDAVNKQADEDEAQIEKVTAIMHKAADEYKANVDKYEKLRDKLKTFEKDFQKKSIKKTAIIGLIFGVLFFFTLFTNEEALVMDLVILGGYALASAALGVFFGLFVLAWDSIFTRRIKKYKLEKRFEKAEQAITANNKTFCCQCGKELLNNSRFCEKCGCNTMFTSRAAYENSKEVELDIVAAVLERGE